jgi:hypothetical protein
MRGLSEIPEIPIIPEMPTMPGDAAYLPALMERNR